MFTVEAHLTTTVNSEQVPAGKENLFPLELQFEKKHLFIFNQRLLKLLAIESNLMFFFSLSKQRLEEHCCFFLCNVINFHLISDLQLKFITNINCKNIKIKSTVLFLLTFSMFSHSFGSFHLSFRLFFTKYVHSFIN